MYKYMKKGEDQKHNTIKILVKKTEIIPRKYILTSILNNLNGHYICSIFVSQGTFHNLYNC